MSERAPVDLLEAFKFALDQAAIVAITDTAGRITYANDYFCRISKYSREELIGQDHRLVNSGHHPKEFIRNLWETIRAGRVWKGEIRNRAKDGTIYWVDTTIVPFLDQDGRPWQYLAIRADITERKRAEQRLFEQGALVKLGEMASVVAHEVKNPLAGIAGAIQVIGGRLPDGSPERAIVGEMLTRIRALNATVEDLLLFARPRAPRPGPLSLPSLVEATVSLLSRDPQAAGVRVEQQVEDVALWGDPEMLKAVLLNVLLNGAQSMGGQGLIRIGSRRVDGLCELAVGDTGPGIPAELRERVFEPFFTTKHRGTGLGLSIARRVMEGHGGGIRLECPPEGGTVVTLSLPLHDGAEARPAAGQPSSAAPAG
ncbi:MAG TPA: ATP-binding protein [Planctomycetota bacterium]|nr:ATP-binding protein [Planctomycetota bacterium]